MESSTRGLIADLNIHIYLAIDSYIDRFQNAPGVEKRTQQGGQSHEEKKRERVFIDRIVDCDGDPGTSCSTCSAEDV